ncbi:MAG: serine/threonine-protein kinase [Pseudomonadota bacterium]
MARSVWSRIFGWAGHAASQSSRFGKYDIVRIIHDGEKAVVYQARSPDDQHFYAIKSYKRLYNRTARRICKRYNLRTEGEIGMMLNPPAGTVPEDYPIVRTVAHGKEFNDSTRCCFLVQEFVDGVNVKHLVGCSDPLLRERRLEIARTLGRALSIIHKRRLVHRDVCTDNILLPKTGCPKLIDLGFLAPRGIRFKEKTGTPSYMSPDQIRVRPLHPASDIYSFGVVLFELFTGELPFKSKFSASRPDLQMRRTSELMDKHLHEPAPRPSEIAPDLPDGLEPIIMKCLEKEVSRRYPDMRGLLAELSAVDDRHEQAKQI